MSKALSERQHDVLAFIHASIRKRGYPPTYREIQAYFDFNAQNRAIIDCMLALEKKGMIARPDSVNSPEQGGRSITITDEGFRALGEATPAEMRLAVAESARLRGLLIRAWAVLTRAGVDVPLVREIRAELRSDESLALVVRESERESESVNAKLGDTLPGVSGTRAVLAVASDASLPEQVPLSIPSPIPEEATP